MIVTFLRCFLAVGIIAIIACDLGDLDGPKPPAYTKTVNPPFNIVLDSTNLITNGGFETSLEGWNCFAIEGGQAQYTRSDIAYTGQYSLFADIQLLGANFWSIQAIWETLLLEDGERYKVSLWVKSTPESGSLRIPVGMNYEPWSYYSSPVFYPTETWEELSFDFTSPDDATSGSQLSLMFSYLGEFWIDDIMVQKYVQVDK